MYKIPDEYRNIPEAVKLEKAQAAFDAAWQDYRSSVNTPLEPDVRHRLAYAQEELKRARASFDAATGEPKPVGLTPAVTAAVQARFPPEQHAQVMELLDRQCGRNLPFHREDSSQDLEFVRLCVIALSKGNLDKLRHFIEIAKSDEREVIVDGRRLLNKQRRSASGR